MGCGTGLVGKYLNDKGYKSVVGVDASRGMLDQCKQKNAYIELNELFLGTPETFPKEYHNRFDFVTGSGILADNHLDCPVFEEMLLALKDYGICIFTSRIEYLTKYRYGPYMEKLTSEGRWKKLKQADHTKYNLINQEIGRYKPTQSTVFAFQKLPKMEKAEEADSSAKEVKKD